MNPYEEKLERRRERLLGASEKASSESDRYFKQTDNLARVIDGQPILIGHHSEKRARRDQRRMHDWTRKGIDNMKAAEDLARRADAVGSGGVSSDDPDAIDKIKERIAELEIRQARMKCVNSAHAQFLKNPASLDSAVLSEDEKGLIRSYKPAYSWEPHPYAPYQFQNNGANIRRLKERIETLEKQSARVTVEKEIGAVRIVENAEENRVQIFFPDKPVENVRKELKGRGFRWSPMAGAWQRHLNGSGTWAAEQFAKWYEVQS